MKPEMAATDQDLSKAAQQVEAAIGDLLDPVSVQTALEGVDKLHLLNAVVPDELTQGLIACYLAKKLKLEQVVYFRCSERNTSPGCWGIHLGAMKILRGRRLVRGRRSEARCPTRIRRT